MGFLKPLYLQLLNILMAAFLECKAETQTSCKHVLKEPIYSAKGDNVSISCLTLTHHSKSFRVKLRRTNTDKDILDYPDSASQHPRWSVKTNSKNVTLDLEDITLDDAGQYECEVHNNGSCLTRFHLKVKDCKVLQPVYAMAKSSVMLTCSDHVNATWEIIRGDQAVNITTYLCNHSKREEATKPLCERAIIRNVSLQIRDVEITDASWYRCRKNKTSCYDVFLKVKGYETFHTTTVPKTPSTALLATDASVSAVNNEDSSGLTAVVTSVVSVCFVISLSACVILCLKKRKSKTNSQIQYTRNSLYFQQDCVYYSQISYERGEQFPLYHLVENPGRMSTFGAEQTETIAYEHANQPITESSS